MNPTSGGIISGETLSKAISEFQAFAGLNITGKSGYFNFCNIFSNVIIIIYNYKFTKKR